jgi:hypothetical protein
MSICRCGHDRLLHGWLDNFTGPCLILNMTAPYPIGCGCVEYKKQPTGPKVKP